MEKRRGKSGYFGKLDMAINAFSPRTANHTKLKQYS